MPWQKNPEGSAKPESPEVSVAAAADTNSRSRLNHWLAAFAVVFAVLVAYHPVWHAGFIWDDDFYVTANPLLTAPDGLRRIWFSLDSPSQYFPLTYTTFYLERAIWGLNPFGYHVINVVLHICNVMLVWYVLSLLRVPGAWLAAAIFALHPVQVESVAWVTERKNVLMAIFFLLAVVAWLRFIDESRGCRRRYYALSLLCYGLALCAKTTACTLPAALILVLWFEKKPITRVRLMQFAPFVVMGIGMGLVTMWWEKHHQGTHGQLFEIGPVERLIIACRALWFYGSKLLWPINLTFSYPRWTISVSDPRAYAWVLATAVVGAVLWRGRYWARRGVSVALAFFALTLSPVLGFIMLYTFVYSFVADHYQYVACIGPIALAAAGMTAGLGRITNGRFLLRPAATTLLLTVLAVLTWKQCGMYQSAETLWQTTIERNPNSWMARSNFATWLSDHGRMNEAIVQFDRALQIKPESAEIRRNLGLAFTRQGRWDEAVAQFQKSLQLEPTNSEAHMNLGNCLSQLGQLDASVSEYQTALEIEPENVQAHTGLGNCFVQMGRPDEAILQFQKALQIKPDLAEAENDLGACFQRQGQVDNAVARYRKAVEINPAYLDARMNLANALSNLGKDAEAVAEFRTAEQQAPNDPRAVINLAWVLATAREPALRDGAKALELARRGNALAGTENPNFLHTLAAALAEAGRFPDAIQTAQHAMELAAGQSNFRLAQQLQYELNLFQAGEAFHLPPLASSTNDNKQRTSDAKEN